MIGGTVLNPAPILGDGRPRDGSVAVAIALAANAHTLREDCGPYYMMMILPWYSGLQTGNPWECLLQDFKPAFRVIAFFDFS